MPYYILRTPEITLRLMTEGVALGFPLVSPFLRWKSKSRHTKHPADSTAPLFPGYCFLRAFGQNYAPDLSPLRRLFQGKNKLTYLYSADKVPALLEDNAFSAVLQTTEKLNYELSLFPLKPKAYGKGDVVRILQGVLQNQYGVVVSAGSKQVLLALAESRGPYFQTVSISTKSLELVKEAPGAPSLPRPPQ